MSCLSWLQHRCDPSVQPGLVKTLSPDRGCERSCNQLVQAGQVYQVVRPHPLRVAGGALAESLASRGHLLCCDLRPRVWRMSLHLVQG